MKLDIKQDFVVFLREAFNQTDVVSMASTEKKVYLESNDDGLFIYGCMNDVGLASRFDATNTVKSRTNGEAFVTERLVKFLTLYRKNFPDNIVLDIQKDATVVSIDDKQVLSLNAVEGNVLQYKTFNEELKNPIPYYGIGSVLEKAMSFCDEIGVRYALNGVLLEQKGNSFNIVGTDGRRMFVNKSEREGQPFKRIISQRSLSKMARCLAGDVELYLIDNGLIFKNDVVTIKVISMVGAYPDYEQIAEARGERKAKVSKSELLECITKASTVLNDTSFGGVYLNFNNDSLTVDTDQTEFGKAIISMLCKYSKPAIKIGFIVKYLMSSFSVIDNDEIELWFNEGTPLTAIDGNTTILVMPFVKN